MQIRKMIDTEEEIVMDSKTNEGLLDKAIMFAT